METFEDFKAKYYRETIPNKHPDIRNGQALMTLLCNFWYEEYGRLSSLNYYSKTDIDCFYNDKLIGNTLNHLEKNWHKYPK